MRESDDLLPVKAEGYRRSFGHCRLPALMRCIHLDKMQATGDPVTDHAAQKLFVFNFPVQLPLRHQDTKRNLRKEI